MHVVWIMANNSTAPYFNWFAEQAAKKGEIKMTFICLYPEPPQMVADMKKYGYECFWIKYDHNYRKSYLLSATYKLFKLFRSIKPDIVHSHLFDDTMMAIPAAKMAGIKGRFITKGDTAFHYYFTPKWVMFDKINNALATQIIAISNESKTFILEKEKAKPNKVHVIHHGIPRQNLGKQTDIIEKLGINGKTVIGTVARFIEWKGYRTIVEAAEKLVPVFPDILFLFIGKGAQKKEIESLVASKKLSEHVKFIDWVNPEDMPSLYKQMKVYAHAAKYEPFGLVIAEAMANGVSVVSTKTGAALDAIEHKKSGYLCDYDKPEELAEGIRFVLNNNGNNAIGEAGKKVAEKMYSIEVMYNNYVELYKQALK